MNPLTRARLFIRDYIQEFPIAWSIARYRDCERNGGHRWGPIVADSMMGRSRSCGRCGTTESKPRPVTGTAATGQQWVTFQFDGPDVV